MQPQLLGRSLFAILLAACLGVAAAQEPAAPQLPATAAPFTLPKGDLTIAELVAKVAGHLHWIIRVSPKEVGEQAPFTLTEALSLDTDGCEEVLCALLYSRMLALMPVGSGKGEFEIVSMSGPRAAEVLDAAVELTPEEILRRPNLKRIVTTTVPLLNTSGAYAANFLRPLFTNNSGRLPTGLAIGQALPRAIVFKGFQDQVANAILLVRAGDALPARPLFPPPPEERVATLEKQVAALRERLVALQKAAANK